MKTKTLTFILLIIVFFSFCDSDNSTGPKNKPPFIVTIANPSFEIFNDSGKPANWNLTEWRPKITIVEKDSTVKTDGSYSLKSTIPDSLPNDVRFNQEITVEKNTHYNIRCDIKTENHKLYQDKTMGAGFFITAGNLAFFSDTLLTGTTNWTNVQVNFNSYNHDFVTITLHIGYICNTNTGIVWFDNLKISKL